MADSSMNNISLTTFVYEPFVYKCVENYPTYCEFPGLDADRLMQELESDGFLINKVHMRKDYPDMLDALISGGADLSMLSTSHSFLVREGVLNQSNVEILFYSRDTFSLISRMNLTKGGTDFNFLLFTICTWQVWLALITTTFMVLLFGKVVDWLAKACRCPTKRPKLVTYVVWGLLMSVFAETASNFLAIAFANPLFDPTLFTTFEQLIPLLETRKCHLATTKVIYDQIQHLFSLNTTAAHTSLRQKLGSIIQDNPIVLRSEEVDIIEYVANSTTCVAGIVYEVALLRAGQSRCHLQSTQDKYLPGQNYYHVVHKQFPHMEKLRMLFQKSVDKYLLDVKLHKKYTNSYCDDPKIDSAKSKLRPLSIAQLQDIFILHVIGLALAGVSLVWQRARLRTTINKQTLNETSDRTARICRPIRDDQQRVLDNFLQSLKPCCLETIHQYAKLVQPPDGIA